MHVQFFSEKFLQFWTDLAEVLYIDVHRYTIMIIALYADGIIKNSEYDMLEELPPGQLRSDMLVYILQMKFKNSAYNDIAHRLQNAFKYNSHLHVLRKKWNELSKNF